MNANKRKLDVWLVYRCAGCGTSWNLPIHERVSPQRLPKGELDGFTQNDAALARRCAMDMALLVRHGCEAAPPEYWVAGDDLPPGQCARVVLRSPFALDLRVGKLLRQKLGLSAKGWETLLESGRARCTSGQDLRRQKLERETEFIICR